MQHHKKDQVPPPKDNNISLLSVLDAIEQLEDRQKNVRKAHHERKVVDLNAPEEARKNLIPTRREEEGILQNKEKFIPAFEGIPQKISHHQHERRQFRHFPSQSHEQKKTQKAHHEQYERYSKNYNKQEPVFRLHHSQPQWDNLKRPFRQFGRQKYSSNYYSPSKKQEFPIRFQESMIYQEVKITICFGNVSLEEEMHCDTLLTIPFPTIDWQSDLFIEIKSKTGKDIKNFLRHSLEISNQSDYRIGEVLDIGTLDKIPYSHIYLMKSPNNETILQFLLDTHLKSVKKLIEKTATDSLRGVVFGEWAWGRLDPYEACRIMLRAILEGIKSLGTVKKLQSVRICIVKKADYQGYAKAFRELSDQYLDAFYRE